MSLSKMLQEYREGLRGLPTYAELAAIASSAPMTPERFAEKMDALAKANPEPMARLMATPAPCADPIVERNVSLLRERSTVGVQKYGTTLADNKLPLRAWLNHALEELLDQANYLQAAMQEIDAVAPKVAMDERQAFETAARRITHSGDSSFEREGDDYVDYTQSRHWSFWQARAALQAAPMQAQEPSFKEVGSFLYVGVEYVATSGDDPRGIKLYRPTVAPVQPVAVPEAAQQNGGLVRAALIDLLSPAVERAANSGAVSFECQSNIATIFARGRQALVQSAFDAAPVAQGDAKDAERYRYIRDTGTLDAAVWAALDGYGCVDEGELDQHAYAVGMDHAIDVAIAAKAAPTPK